jgi:hypothetical protein
MTAELSAALAPFGLILRGGFHLAPEDQVPLEGATLLLVGNAGSVMWRIFSKQAGGETNPLDSWTRQTLDKIAEEFGARALYPFGGAPFLPFQRWAMKAEAVFPSPVGPLIHPLYGLWHAYRGALVFAEKLELPERVEAPSPCAVCPEKFCVKACPAGVFAQGKYDVPLCLGELARPGNQCSDRGCLSRHACPIGQEFAYDPDHAAFHMRAFKKSF